MTSPGQDWPAVLCNELLKKPNNSLHTSV